MRSRKKLVGEGRLIARKKGKRKEANKDKSKFLLWGLTTGGNAPIL